MTNPHPLTDEVGDLPVTPTSLVLQARELHPDTDRPQLSRFGDLSWDLFPALPDRHSANQAIHWDLYPIAFRHAAKLYVFALLNVVEHAPRLAYAHTTFPSVKTIWADLGHLRLLLAWLAERGITRFADVTTADLDHYLRHVTDAPQHHTQTQDAAGRATPARLSPVPSAAVPTARAVALGRCQRSRTGRPP